MLFKSCLTHEYHSGILARMLSRIFVDTNNTNRNTRTRTVTGRWYLSDEQQQGHSS